LEVLKVPHYVCIAHEPLLYINTLLNFAIKNVAIL
jgi:hypothetical protein